MSKFPNDTPEQQAIALADKNLRLRAELDAAKAMLQLPTNYCMVCGGTGGHHEGCKGVSGLIALSSLLAAKQGELEKAKANEARLEAALNTLAEFEYKGADWRQRKSTALSDLLGPTVDLLQLIRDNPLSVSRDRLEVELARLRAAIGQKT